MSEHLPEISIIIPFYNIHDCVEYCLQSVLNQTFVSFEALCIDDGSTDGTGEILDRVAQKDERLVVLHKSNGGLSSARNYGVSQAKGRYVTFLDGDDILSPYCLESLYQAMDDANDRMVIGKALSLRQSDVSRPIGWEKCCHGGLVFSREDVCRGILSKAIGTTAWAKLAPRGIYEDVSFPEGVRYEELQTIASFISAVDSFRIVDVPVYGYVMREGSIVWSKAPSAKQAQEYLAAVERSTEALGGLHPHLQAEKAYYRAVMMTRIHDFISRGLDDGGVQVQIEQAVHSAVKESLPLALKNASGSTAQKARLVLYTHAPSIYDKVMTLYNSWVKGVSF